MSNFNQVELQNLKSLIEHNETLYKKLDKYASQAENPQIKQCFKYKTKIIEFF